MAYNAIKAGYGHVTSYRFHHRFIESQRMRWNKFLVLLAVLGCFISACTSPVPVPAPSPTPTQKSVPVAQPLPTEIPSPTSLPSPTITFPPEPSQAAPPTETPHPALGEVELIGLAWYEDYDLLLSFQFSGPVNPSDYRITLEDKEYRCEVLDGLPDRLYCKGQGAKVLAEATVRIYPAGSVLPGFIKEVWIPYFDNNYDSYNSDF